MKSSWFIISLSVSDDTHKLDLRGQQINFLPHKKKPSSRTRECLHFSTCHIAAKFSLVAVTKIVLTAEKQSCCSCFCGHCGRQNTQTRVTTIKKQLWSSAACVQHTMPWYTVEGSWWNWHYTRGRSFLFPESMDKRWKMYISPGCNILLQNKWRRVVSTPPPARP